jgi:magnesium transporter
MNQTMDHLNQPIHAVARRDFISLPQDLDVSAALDWIRHTAGLGENIIYFYVVNPQQQLVGVLPARRLLTAPLQQRIADVMISRVVTVPQSATVLEVCKLFLQHKFLAIPVIDDRGRIVGVVDISLFTEEVFDISEKERREDVFQTIGFHVATVRRASPLQSFRHRFPWLLATILAGVICAFLAGAYQATLSHSIVIAFFLALVLGLGESVSVQSLAVTVQALHVQPLTMKWFVRAAKKELLTALLLGGASGLIVGLIVWVWRGAGLPAFVIGVSLLLAVSVACLMGLSIPSLLHRFKLDPKIAAGPIALALTDVFTLLFYFNLARWLL